MRIQKMLEIEQILMKIVFKILEILIIEIKELKKIQI
jgi:hypothetical protein